MALSTAGNPVRQKLDCHVFSWLIDAIFWQTLHMDEADESGTGAADALAAGAIPPTRLPAATSPASKIEIGGREGPEPTRYGDWELRGRCIDF
jgi:hypothetical protein